MRLVAAGLVGPPDGPGTYAFRDATGALLYVGTSRDLPHRLRSYFAPRHAPGSKVGRIVRLAERVEWQPAESVLEALVSEARLIRTERPYFNRRLKETGRYAYVRFAPGDPFPRLQPTRRLSAGPWRYLGPFPGGRGLRTSVERVADAFGLRTCPGRLAPDPAGRACLRLELGQCAAPCVARVGPGEYGRRLTRALAALGGDDPLLARRLGGHTLPVPPLPGPVRATVRALRAARAEVTVLVVVPAAHGCGQRVLAVAGGRLVGAASLESGAQADASLAELRAALLQPQSPLLPLDAVDEVRIVTAWLATPAGRRASVAVGRVGFSAAWREVAARVEAARAPGPLFAVRSGVR